MYLNQYFYKNINDKHWVQQYINSDEYLCFYLDGIQKVDSKKKTKKDKIQSLMIQDYKIYEENLIQHLKVIWKGKFDRKEDEKKGQLMYF